MKKVMILMVAAAFTIAGATAQSTLPNAAKGEKMSSRGADPNIKADKAAVMKQTPSIFVKPGEKATSETESRGAAGTCTVIFDNWTNYYIDCYTDGYYSGYAAPFGKLYVYVSGGNTSAYGVATFTDGSSLYWGPLTRYCSSSEWTVSWY